MEIIKNKYEIVMIFSVEGGDDNAKALSTRFQKLIEENATIDSVEEWGKRRLAYPIQDEPDGHYLLVTFTSETDFPAEIERVLSITDHVLRSMVIRLEDDAVTKATAVEPKVAEVKVAEAVEETAEAVEEAKEAVEAVAKAVETATEAEEAIEAIEETVETVTETAETIANAE